MLIQHRSRKVVQPHLALSPILIQRRPHSGLLYDFNHPTAFILAMLVGSTAPMNGSVRPAVLEIRISWVQYKHHIPEDCSLRCISVIQEMQGLTFIGAEMMGIFKFFDD